jgi:hypothetical protein
VDRNKIKFLLVWIGIIVVVVAGLFVARNAMAGSSKVTICHATASEKNKYVQINIDASSIDEEKNRYLNGHGDHEEDIIPPFTFGSSSFEGLNWNSEGIAIWENGCKISEVKPTPKPTPEPTPEPTLEPEPVVPSPSAEATDLPQPPVEVVEETSPAIEEKPVAVEEELIIPEIVVPEKQPEETPLPKPIRIDAGGGGTIVLPSLK